MLQRHVTCMVGCRVAYQQFACLFLVGLCNILVWCVQGRISEGCLHRGMERACGHVHVRRNVLGLGVSLVLPVVWKLEQEGFLVGA
jgi:hypothetical protein